MNVSGRAQCRYKLRDVIGSAGLHGHVDHGVTEVYAVVGTIVGCLDDIGLMARQDSCEPVQGARVVREMNADAYKPAVLHQAALDNARQQCHVNISPAH